MRKRESRDAVSPVIAVILMVAITVVLAAVLFVMVQQYTEDNSSNLAAMTVQVDETPLGWTIKIIAGTVENNTDVSYYVLNTTTGVPENASIIWNDLDSNNKFNAGDSFVIDDPTWSYLHLNFVFNAGSNTLEYEIKEY